MKHSRKANGPNKYVILLLLAELLAICAAAMSFRHQDTYRFEAADLMIDRGNGVYESGVSTPGYIDYSFDGNRLLVSPEMELPAGIYRISLDYRSDGTVENDVISRLVDTKDLSAKKSGGLVLSENNEILGEKTHADYRVWVKARSACRIESGLSENAGKRYLLIREIRLEYLTKLSVIHAAAAAFFLFLILDLLLWFLVVKKEETGRFFRENAVPVTVIAGVLAVSLIPLLTPHIYFGDDIQYHLQRIARLATGIKSGTFPVKIQPGWDGGYGYAAGVCYGDLFFLPSAILVLLGFPLETAYEFYIVLITVLTVLISYYAFFRLSGKTWTALAGCILYTFAGFRMHSIFSGATVGEFSAYTFLPLVILGLYIIYREEDKGKGVLFLGTGIACVVSVHVLSTFILLLTIPVYCLLRGRKTFRKEVFTALLESVGLALLLSAWFIVPMAEYVLLQPMAGTGSEFYKEAYLLWNGALDPVRLFVNYPDPKGIDSGWSGAGFASGAAVLLSLYLLAAGKAGKEAGTIRRLAAADVWLMFMATKAFPYYWISRRLPFLHKVLRNLQFPWHFLNLICVVSTVLAVLCLKVLSEENAARAYAAAFVCVFLCFVQLASFYGAMGAGARSVIRVNTEDSHQFSAVDEFNIRGSDRELPKREPGLAVYSGNVRAEITGQKGTTVTAAVVNEGSR